MDAWDVERMPSVECAGQHFLMQRKQHGGNKLPLTDQQYDNMCIVQMADWLQQVALQFQVLLVVRGLHMGTWGFPLGEAKQRTLYTSCETSHRGRPFQPAQSSWSVPTKKFGT